MPGDSPVRGYYDIHTTHHCYSCDQHNPLRIHHVLITCWGMVFPIAVAVVTRCCCPWELGEDPATPPNDEDDVVLEAGSSGSWGWEGRGGGSARAGRLTAPLWLSLVSHSCMVRNITQYVNLTWGYSVPNHRAGQYIDIIIIPWYWKSQWSISPGFLNNS